MTDYFYAVTPLRIIGKDAFLEASKEELRVLLLLVELGGKFDSAEELASLASISVARCRSALSFWEESGIIVRRTEDTPAVMTEFDEIIRPSEITEVAAVDVAKTIRDEGIALMFSDFESMLGRTLSQTDIKTITALYTQYSLSTEYILTLAANLHSRNVLTIERLRDEAIRLVGKDIDNAEILDVYLADKEKTSAYELEYRRVMGIFRRLSKTERQYFKKWAEEFQYSAPIIAEAYDHAVMNTKSGKGDFRYMDSVLTSWHENNCHTVSECKAFSEAKRMKNKISGAGKTSKTQAPTPKYGNFDVNDAFAKALERSYGEDN